MLLIASAASRHICQVRPLSSRVTRPAFALLSHGGGERKVSTCHSLSRQTTVSCAFEATMQAMLSSCFPLYHWDVFPFDFFFSLSPSLRSGSFAALPYDVYFLSMYLGTFLVKKALGSILRRLRCLPAECATPPCAVGQLSWRYSRSRLHM